LQHADHFLLVAGADGDVDRRLHALAQWLLTAPGQTRRRTATAVLVSRGITVPNWSFADLPVVVVPRDEGLRRRRPDRLGRRAAIAGLNLAAEVAVPGGAAPAEPSASPGPLPNRPGGPPPIDPAIFGRR